jgi:hypothetical protein
MVLKVEQKNKIKPAEEMIDKGDFDPSGFAGGGLAYMLGEPVRMFKGGRDWLLRRCR